MKIENMRNERTADGMTFWDVDVIERRWLSTRTETKTVYRDGLSSFFRWLDSGQFTPSFQVESLYSALLAKKAMEKS